MENLRIPKDYFETQLFYLFLLGVSLNPFKNKWSRLAYLIYAILVGVVFGLGYFISEGWHIVMNMENVEEVTLAMVYFFAHCSAAGKFVVLLWKRDTVRSFLGRLEQGEFRVDLERGGTKEVELIQQAVNKLKLQGGIFAVTLIATLGNRLLQTILHHKIEIVSEDGNTTETILLFPFSSTLPLDLDVQKTPYYQLVFVYQTLGMFYVSFFLFNTDIIITGLMIHIQAQFKLLTNAFATVFERARQKTKNRRHSDASNKYETSKTRDVEVWAEKLARNERKLDEKLKEFVNRCIGHHQDIIQLMIDMESTFSLMMLMQFGGSLLSMCFCLYQSSLYPVNNPSFVTMSTLTAGIGLQLLLYCFNGNEISLESVRVAEAAYNCQWITADEEIKKSLIFVILRGQHACNLTAGKFSTLSLETFTSIIKGSFSYFMVLRQVNEQIEVDK